MNIGNVNGSVDEGIFVVVNIFIYVLTEGVGL